MKDNVQPSVIKTPAGPLPDYNFETATEGERWAYDQGYEAGWDQRRAPDELRTMTVAELLDEVRILLAAARAAADRLLDACQEREG